MSIGSILGALSPISMGMDVAEHAQKTDFMGRIMDGSADVRDGLFTLNPGKLLEGLKDMSGAIADQVTNPEFLGLVAYGALGCATGGIGIFALGAIAGELPGWFKDDKKAPVQGDANARFADQVDPRAPGDLRELRDARNGAGCQGSPNPSAGQCEGGSSDPTQPQLHVENNVIVDGNGDVIVKQTVNVDSGAYATGGAHGSSAADGAQGAHTGGTESVEVNLEQIILWAKERGYLTAEELDQAARITNKDGKKVQGWVGTHSKGLNPDENKELRTLLEKKLKSDPDFKASFESSFGKLDFTREPKDNGFVYVTRPAATHTHNPPAPTGYTVRDPPVSGPPKSDPTYSLPRVGSGDTGGSRKIEVSQNVTINSYTPQQRDPNRFEGLSPEQIVRMLMNELMTDADGAMVSKAHELKDAQEREMLLQNKKANGEKVSPEDEAKAKTNVTQLNNELQDIMAKRKQTFDLISHFTSNQHEMAKTALGNIGRI